MPAYSYKALDADGNAVEGVLDSDTPRSARQTLREQGKLPLTVDLVAQEPAARAWSPFLSRGIPNAQLAVVTRQFSTLLAAGLTIDQALSALVEQATEGRARDVLAGVRAEVRSGHTLSAALERFEHSFPILYRSIVGAGEQSGELAEVMQRLADHVESSEQLKQKVILALIYPAIVSLVALAVVVALMTYVVPQVVSVFEHSKQGLPILTRILIFTSVAVRSSIWAMLALGVIAVVAASRLWRREAVRERVHHWLLATPVIGRLVRGVNTARFASTLAILTSSGVPILAAFHTAASVVASLPMRHAVENAAGLLREGSSLSQALRQSGQFPPVLLHLVVSGEATGRLAETLRAAAKQQELEVTLRVTALTTILEPALILAMGLFVLAIVLAILQPIIDMNQLVR